MDQGFYLVKLESLSDCNIKHYVAQHDASKNVGEFLLMSFMHKEGNEFGWMNSDGLVSSSEKMKLPSDPQCF